MEVINKFKREFRVAEGLDGGTSEACRATFPNVQLRAVGGVSGGHGARLAERLSKLSNKGGRWGLMVVGQSEALAERLDLNFGVVAGGDGGIECVGLSRRGKSACGL